MLKLQKKSAPSTDKNDRRRGRPAGKNRTPLSQEERRARNAQYERERRNETAEAMMQLAETAGCDSQIANAELLATVISQLQRREKRQHKHSLDDMRRINKNLEFQIATLQQQLGQDIDVSTEEDTNDYDHEEMVPKKFSKRRNESTKQNRAPRSKRIRKASTSESDTNSSSSNSNWSASLETEPATQNHLPESSNQLEASELPMDLPNDPALVIPETALLEALTEGEIRSINEWIDNSENLSVSPVASIKSITEY